MTLSVFSDKSKPPQDSDLAKELGTSHSAWKQLIQDLSMNYAPLTVEWGFSSPKTGWGLRLKQEKRAIIYMVPCSGFFLASFALGEKAVKTAHEANLPTSVLQVIDDAPRYAEGRGVRIKVSSTQEVATIERLAEIKMAT